MSRGRYGLGPKCPVTAELSMIFFLNLGKKCKENDARIQSYKGALNMQYNAVNWY